MQALILNSGLGSRMGALTETIPKCMIKIDETNSILSRQLQLLQKYDINDVVMTTGPYHTIQSEYIKSLNLSVSVDLVRNDRYAETNYIYSMLLAKEHITGDLIIMHGDLVFTDKVLEDILMNEESGVIVSSTEKIPEKDFKVKIIDGTVVEIGVDIFEGCLASQPMYYFTKFEWDKWMEEIELFCKNNDVNCYAEKALNNLLKQKRIILKPIDIKELLCQEIDCIEDLENTKVRLMRNR